MSKEPTVEIINVPIRVRIRKGGGCYVSELEGIPNGIIAWGFTPQQCKDLTAYEIQNLVHMIRKWSYRGDGYRKATKEELEKAIQKSGELFASSGIQPTDGLNKE